MQTPADKRAKRESREEWFLRYDAADLLKPPADTRAKRLETRPPADRVATRA
jgi:hypothetical protein